MGVCLVTGGKSQYSGLYVFVAQDVKATISAYACLRVRHFDIAKLFEVRVETVKRKVDNKFNHNTISSAQKLITTYFNYQGRRKRGGLSLPTFHKL